MSKLSNLSLVVTLFLSSLLFISCKKEKGGEEWIVGTWKVEDTIIEVEGDDPEVVEFVISYLDMVYGSLETTYTFHSDGTVNGFTKSSSGEEAEGSGTYSFTENTFTMIFGSEEDKNVSTFDYVVDGNYLTLSMTSSQAELEEMSLAVGTDITKMVIQQVLKKNK